MEKKTKYVSITCTSFNRLSPLYIASLTVVVLINLSHKTILVPSYFIMFPKTEVRIVLFDTLFRNSDESEDHPFMDTSNIYV